MIAIAIILVTCIVSFLLEAGTVWILVWCLKAIGVTTICGWTVAFSWPLVLIIWLISWSLHSIFGGKKK